MESAGKAQVRNEFMEKMPPIEQLRGRPIGRVLMKMGLLTREKVHHCLEVQKQRQQKEHKNIPIGEIFVELGLVEEKHFILRWPPSEEWNL